MVRLRSSYRSACFVALLLVGVSRQIAAQRGTLTATFRGQLKRPSGDTLVVQMAVGMTPGWHIGAEHPGMVGVPTALSWRLPSGWRVLSSRWPAPKAVILGRDTVFQYDRPFIIESFLSRSGSSSGRIQAIVSYGICREVCIPGRLAVTYEVR